MLNYRSRQLVSIRRYLAVMVQERLGPGKKQNCLVELSFLGAWGFIVRVLSQPPVICIGSKGVHEVEGHARTGRPCTR